MDKDTLNAKLEDLKQQSQNIIDQINTQDTLTQGLREQALIIKGKYQAIEQLIAEIPEVAPDTTVPVEGEVVSETPDA